ncbi:DUF5819 family protein [Streptomyces sp. 12297]|uniref:DUF5819 family protein n=1 Tax=Streptomyces sp. NBC_00239 TaxID=2903640 RepID=UPI002E2E146B|nr:DUF5819 family protein [Streptomyces sp. NBC_00239]
MDSNEHEAPRGPVTEGAEAAEGAEVAADEAADEAAEDGVPAPRAPGLAGLSGPYRIAAALVLAAVAVAACWHLALVFLHVAPSNTLTKEYGQTVDEWVYPEFEQNWKLFAPNPLQQNIAVEVRAQIRTRGGDRVTTGWRDLSAEDGAAIRHNLLPSHVHQNELRRAWDFYTGSHDDQNRATGDRGELAEAYLRRIVLRRLTDPRPGGALDQGGEVLRVQLRSATASVAAPPWSDEKIDTQTYHRQLPWWLVTEADR